MKISFRKYMLATALAAITTSTMAQEFNSAYFTDDFKYRHDMNPAYGNDQGYAAIPIFGNLNMKLQGSLGVGDVLFKNPDYGRVQGAKKTATFLHPSIPVDEALKNIEKGANTVLFDMDIPIASVGFNAFDGYNTVELKERTHLGVSLPYEFFQFAKDMKNQHYSFDDMGLRGWSYLELAFGHSRQIFENLRVGAKVKFLFGMAYANVSMDGVQAHLEGDHWLIDGKARGELNMNGVKFKEKEEEYKSRPGTYKRVDGVDTDGASLGGFGLGLDLGGIYEFQDCSVEWLEGLKASLALTDLGFISWSKTLVAESSGNTFQFDGFNNFAVKEESGKTIDDQMDDYEDKLKDFANLENKGNEGGSTHALAATMRFGLEYPLPVYDKISFGSLFTHRFDGKYSWSEERISANYKPLKWVDGGINLAFTSFCTTMGWILNFHPKGANVFIGMDHMIGKTGASSVPLDSNVSFNFGLNVTWGGKKSFKRLDTLTF